MNAESLKNLFSPFSKKVVIISLALLFLILVVIFSQIAFTTIKSDKIHKGITISGINAGNMTKNDVRLLLEENYGKKAADSGITLKHKQFTEKISYTDIKLSFDIDQSLNSAYEIGRTGNLFKRFSDIYRASSYGICVDLPYSYDKAQLEKIVQSLYDKSLVNVKEVDLLIQENRVVMRSGKHGESFDKAALLDEIEASLKECRNEVKDVPVIKTFPNKVNVDELLKMINCDASDAHAKVEGNNVEIVPQVNGRNIDRAVFAAIAAELDNTEGIEKVLPVNFIYPKETKETLSSKLFKDVFSTAYTQFYTGNQNDSNRGENIKLATAKINGKILSPGEVFSFNEVVGPRDKESGYKIAHTYAAGQIVDDIGGGICQVSTTLYNAILQTDLDVTERSNHMFTVAYVPLGRDAAVSYPGLDFKFVNSTAYPLKIETWVTKENRLYFSLKGTNETPGKTYEIVPKIVKTNDFTVKYIDDPAMDEGVYEANREGMTGYVVDTYKIVRMGGKVISETQINKSIYTSLEREVRRGTRKPQ